MLDILVVDQFIDALHDEDTRLRIRQSQPKTLCDSLPAALELDSFQQASRRPRAVRGVQMDAGRRSPTADTEETSLDRPGWLDGLLKDIKECVNADRSRGGISRGRIPRGEDPQMNERRKSWSCWKCGKPGHIRRNCTQEEEPARIEASADLPTAEVPSGNGY